MVAATASQLDPAAIPAANVRPPGNMFPAEDFQRISNVAIFAEHETTAVDGRPLKFSQAELQAVCDRSNRRISETGDYAVICLGHTPIPGSNSPEPKTVGFAGPFRLGQVGVERKRYAILADFNIYRDRINEVKDHPRRSPELWLEDDYADMFLDPIALLGASAPRLDMGLLYSADRQGQQVERYTAVCASPMNTTVPTSVGVSKKRKSYAAETPVLTPEDLQQIVESIMQTEQMQWVASQMQTDAGTNSVLPEEVAPPVAPGPELGAPGIGEPGVPPGAPAPIAPAPAAPAPTAPPAGPPAAEPAGPPEPPAGPPAAPPADDGNDREKMTKPYSADNGEVDGVDTIADAEVDGTDSTADGSVATDSSDPDAGEYQTAKPPQQYAREGNVKANAQGEVDAMRAELAKLRGEVDHERGQRVDAERYAALSEKSQCYCLDLTKEVERARYGQMSPVQFKDHLDSIDENYRPIPIGRDLPSGVWADQAAAHNPHRPGQAKEQYSREAIQKTVDYCAKRASTGQTYVYEEVLEKYSKGETPAE